MIDLAGLPETEKRLRIVANQAKAWFQRLRPFVVDPNLVGCDRTDTKPLTAYPSGHATLAYAQAPMLQDLFPTKAAAIQARADDDAFRRLVCGVRYRSDVAAGRTLGLRVARDLLDSPKLRPQLDAARAELRSARRTP